LLLLLPLLLLL
jgi:hypothetical protein